MASNVFISFRFSDGAEYKERLEELFAESDTVINYSEDKDRSGMTEETIRKYLYDKLRETSVTIVVLTPEAVNHKKDIFNQVDDWIYDEVRYSLEDREDNRTNGVIALYTKEAIPDIMSASTHSCPKCGHQLSEITMLHDFDNIVRKNMLNVKDAHKYHGCDGVYNELHDCYVSLVFFDDFVNKNNHEAYIKNALEKRDRLNQFNLVKRI